MVYKTFTQEGIIIPFPQRDLHIKSFDGITASLPKEEVQKNINPD